MMSSIDVSVSNKLTTNEILDYVKNFTAQFKKEQAAKGITIQFKNSEVVERKATQGIVVVRIYYEIPGEG